MKTLKKTLCLVLAVVMAVGVMVLPANAAKEDYDAFIDKTKVQYEEAVATLTGMGIISGKDKQHFYPEAELTRAEAMTLIVRAVLADGVNTLPTNSLKFTDVPKDHFANKYVNWAVVEGIAAGKSATEFCPDVTVTAYEMARWLLVATGAKTDFDSANWQTQTGPAAAEAGFFTGLTKVANDPNKKLTREEAAQMLWNAINYTTGEIKSTYTVTDALGNVYYQGGSSVEAAAAAAKVEGAETTLKRVWVGSIGDEKYDLTKEERVVDPDLEIDEQDPWGREVEVKWTNGKAAGTRDYVLYSLVTRGGINEFYAGAKVTVGDILKCLDMVADKDVTFTLRVDGNYVNDFNMGDPAKVIYEGTRGARVMVYPEADPNRYVVYINYTYASLTFGAAADSKTVHLKYDYTGKNQATDTRDVSRGALKNNDLVIFDLSRKAVPAMPENMLSYSHAMEAQVTGRGNWTTSDPYIRLNKSSTKYYISAKAIIVTLNSAGGYDVDKLDVKNDGLVSTKNYKVWFDHTGNILALVEIKPETTTPTKKTLTNFAYVLEYSTKTGKIGYDADDMTYGTEDIPPVPAEAKVLVVDLKTGSVSVQPLKVNQKGTLGNETWAVAGLDGKDYIAITKTIQSAIGTDPAQTGYQVESNTSSNIIHGFVTYVVNTDGTWSVVNLAEVQKLYPGVYNENYTIGKDFDANGNPGRIDVTLLADDTKTNVHHSDLDCNYYLLDKAATTLDAGKTRVVKYAPEEIHSYQELGKIDTDWATAAHEGVAGKGNVHYGAYSLFILDTTTNMVETAYIFGHRVPEKAVTVNDWLIFTGRDESKLGEGTVFHFIDKDGKPRDYVTDNVDFDDMFEDKNNDVDAVKYPVCVVTHTGDKLEGIVFAEDLVPNDKVFDTYEWVTIKVDGIVPGHYIAAVDWANIGEKAPNFVAKTASKLQAKDSVPLTSNCLIFDANTGKVVTTVPVGKTVYAFVATDEYNSFSIIYIPKA